MLGRWLTLTDFVKYLGKTGKCKVDQTEKGWHILLIQQDPMEMLSEERRVKRHKEEKVRLFALMGRKLVLLHCNLVCLCGIQCGHAITFFFSKHGFCMLLSNSKGLFCPQEEEERQKAALEEQIARAQQTAKPDEGPAQATELHRDEGNGEPLKLSMVRWHSYPV